LRGAAGLQRACRHLRARLRRARPPAVSRLRLSDKIRLVPGHCDPTVNLYDWYVGIRANRVEQLWPITARGAVY
jgi:D-serine deaminase-like pyridoxal phosphate-dependent protein